jgi:ArsR family transcriptional regulator
VFYRQVEDSLLNTLNGFVQEACPVGRPLRRESAALADERRRGEPGADEPEPRRS